MIAALFVEAGGIYAREGVDLWDIKRDARKYAGPWPVVAHPPCERWGRYWFGSPSGTKRFKKGDDGGCFASALASVRKWGGVLEHPADSFAWSAFNLNAPARSGGWEAADFYGGWTCCVEQGAYGHRARKPTWLYAVGVPMFFPVDFAFTRATLPPQMQVVRERGERSPNDAIERMGKAERLRTPPAFAELLLSMARSVRREAA